MYLNYMLSSSGCFARKIQNGSRWINMVQHCSRTNSEYSLLAYIYTTAHSVNKDRKIIMSDISIFLEADAPLGIAII